MGLQQGAPSHIQNIEAILERGDQLGFKLSIPSESSLDTPLIVLLGWLGCQDRFLCKYSDFLENAGYPTLRAICPPAAVMAPHPAPRRSLAKDILRFISVIDEGDMSRPIIFYVFSNGGGFILEQIDFLLAAKNLNNEELAPLLEANKDSSPHPGLFNIAGVIFDSAPCYMHFHVGARALGEGKSLPLKMILAIAFAISMCLGFLLHPFWPHRYWKHMTHLSSDLKKASLYLYSEDDPLCDYALLKKLIETRQAAASGSGNDPKIIVKAHCWKESQHVGHLRCHPKEYKSLVFDFIEEITEHK
ncbi:putative Transmembrane protein 53-B [Nannochloris sp. 'desiccata']|nr:hypothetical protein KSW81_001257 [Chlorella desiccata (nom. nud.)]KAH7617619.1 putative Transmembrane protein 53-B [Chlorella desiccata (nom. nud.)]KAH7622727.1 putative Transmembrane protein 53-B [Chlorella desiccata (nom. nud.)]